MSFTRYTGYTSPPYPVQFTDDTGASINLTGVNPATAFTIIMQNTQTLQFQHGVGVWTITDAANGKASYQWTAGDLAVPGTFLIYVTVQIPGETSPRAFDPDTVIVVLLETGGVAVSGTDINLVQVSGQPVSSANPVPISGPITTADGGNVTQGAKSDAAWSGTGDGSVVAILKKLVAELAGTLAITATDGAIASLGTEADAAWSGSGSGTAIAILKKIEAVLAVGSAVTVSNFPATQPVTSVDGGIVAIGAKGDAAITNPALSASQVALLKGLITLLAGTLTISGSVNVGNFPATQAVSSADGSIASLGAVGDAAWSGSGNGTAIAILKKIEAVIAGTLTVGGSVSVSNFPGTQTVNGTVTSNAGSGTFTNQQSNVQSDYDTGAGTQNATMFGVALPGNGGAVAGGTSSNPLRTDPTGTTTQPVSGTITSNAGTGNFNNASVSTDGSAIPASSTLIGASDGTNLQQLLVESSSNRNLRTGLYNGANEAAVDSAGNQQVKGGFSEQSGLTAGSLNADLVPSTDVSAYKSFSLHINANAYSGTLTFQCSNDNVNWDPLSVDLSDGTAFGSTTSSTNVLYFSGIAFRYLRIRMTSYTSGTAQATLELYTQPFTTSFQASRQTGTWTVQPGNTANSTPWLVNASQIGGQAPKLDNTNELGVSLYGKNSAAGDTPIKVNSSGDQYVLGDFTEQASLSAGSLNADLVASTDVSAYKFWSLQVTGAFVGTLSFQGSNDGVNFVSTYADQSSANFNIINSTTGTGLFWGAVNFRYLRIRMTSYTSGTANGVTELYTSPSAFHVIGAQAFLGAGSNSIGTVQPGNTPNTTPWLESIHDGTNKANVLPATSVSNAIGSQGALLTGGAFAEQASLSAGSLNADFVASVDVSNYKSFSIQVTGVFTGTLTVQGSNDNANFNSAVIRNINSGSNEAQTIPGTGIGTFVGDIAYRYLRIRMTSYTSGTANGTLELYTSPIRYGNTSTTNQNGSWFVGPASDVTLIASGAQTTTQTTADQTNQSGKGVRVVLDMTSVGTGSVTLEIDAKDVASGKYVPLLTGAAVTTNSTNVYVVYPGLTPAANAIVSDVLPRTWRVKVTANNANSATYSVGASYLT